MVSPVSPADLPGPSELAAAQSDAASQSKLAPEPVLDPQPEAVIAQDMSSILSSPESMPPPQTANVPFPGDDLLSELLDESLVAHADAPRPADNPFAADLGLTKAGTVDGATIFDASAGSAPFVDPDAEDDHHAALEGETESGVKPEPGTKPEPEPIEELPVLPVAADEGDDPAISAYNDNDESDEGRAQSTNKSINKGGSNDTTPDPNTPGHSNMSGGPPPKRRRT
jgi:hypothetical protein